MLKESLTFGLQSHAGSIAHHLLQRLPHLLVNGFLGTRALAFYGIGNSIAEKLWMIVKPLYTVVLPRVSGGDEHEAALLVAKISRTLMMLLVVLAAILGGGSPFLISLLYGPEFAPAAGPLVILVVGVIFLGVSWFAGLYFVGQLKRPGVTTVIAWLSLLVAAPSYYVFSRLWGVNGAAAASTVTYVAIFAATILAFVKQSGIPLRLVLFPTKEDWDVLRKAIAAKLSSVRCKREYIEPKP